MEKHSSFLLVWHWSPFYPTVCFSHIACCSPRTAFSWLLLGLRLRFTPRGPSWFLTCSSLLGSPEFQKQARRWPWGFSLVCFSVQNVTAPPVVQGLVSSEGLVEMPSQAPPRQAESESGFLQGLQGPPPPTVTLTWGLASLSPFRKTFSDDPIWNTLCIFSSCFIYLFLHQ